VLIGAARARLLQVGRLSSETDLTEPAVERRDRFETIVLRRALTQSTELYDWRKRIVDGARVERRADVLDDARAPQLPRLRLWSSSLDRRAASGPLRRALGLQFAPGCDQPRGQPPPRPPVPAPVRLRLHPEELCVLTGDHQARVQVIDQHPFHLRYLGVELLEVKILSDEPLDVKKIYIKICP
jgi:hypothetical protein